MALAGTTVAYQKLMIPGEGEVGNAVWLVYVRDLRNGRVVRKLPTGAAPPGAHAVGVGRVLKMVVRADGGVAWTVEDRFGPPGVHFYQVRAVDKTGNRLLASGAEVQPESLTLQGSALSWTQGGQLFSSTLN